MFAVNFENFTLQNMSQFNIFCQLDEIRLINSF